MHHATKGVSIVRQILQLSVKLEMCNEQQMGDHSNISSLETPVILA